MGEKTGFAKPRDFLLGLLSDLFNWTLPTMLETLSASKSEILDAAALSFMRLGYDNASLDDVAAGLGSTKGRIYHHFNSKGALLGAVQLRAARFTYEAVAPVADPTLPAQDTLHAMSRAHVRAVLRTLPYHKVILQTHAGFPVDGASCIERELHRQVQDEQRQYSGLFREVIDRGMADGSFEFRSTNVVLSGVLILLNAPVFWYQERPNQPAGYAHSVADQLADMALASVRAVPGQTRRAAE
jgi:AcrR family transcriptional regulator